MTEAKRPLKVFLCHAHADRDAVRTLYTRLTDDGVDAWLDKEKLLPGQDWELEIKKAVREADVVVVCLSKQFNQAGFRQKEVRLALDTAMEKPEGEIFIIPARLEECDNLESLRKWHWVDLFEDDGYEMLMRALRARADRIGATLQIKRSWMPKITSPLQKKQKPVENKTTKTSDKKIVNNADGISPSSELPDGWEAQWQAAFVKNAKEEKETVETTDTKVDRSSVKKTRKPNTILIVSFIVLVMASIFGLPSLFDTPMDDIPTATQTKMTVALETQTPKPSSTPSIPTSTKAPSFTATPTPLPTEITDAKGVSMMLVSGDGIDTFYMDKFEVTNELYKKCVDFGLCLPPTNTIYYNQGAYLNHPIVYVNKEMAQSYCEWRDARLPTGSEWEGAVGSSLEGNLHDCKYGNFGYGVINANYLTGSSRRVLYCIGATVPVGSYELGKSDFNIYDLIGNVAEFIDDINGDIEGGSWADYHIRTKGLSSANESSNTVGFRCVRDLNP